MCGDLRRRADRLVFTCFFFFNDTATTEIYTLSLHDALPISRDGGGQAQRLARRETGPHAPAQIPEREVFHHQPGVLVDRKSTRLNSSHSQISYAVFCLKKKNNIDS